MSAGHCYVRQLPNRDYTEPAFQIAIETVDDVSDTTLTLDVGTVPGGNDVVEGRSLGGPSTVLNNVSIFEVC